MGIALTLKQYLDDQHISYEVMTHARTSSSSSTAEAGHVSGHDFAKAVVLKRDGGYIMVVVPATRHVALSEVSHRLNEPVGLATEEEIDRLFPDCETGAIPPIASAYGLTAMVDECLESRTDIYCEAGDHQSLLHMSGDEFRRLTMGMSFGAFSCKI
jgi:Ala-tRNA(Pro) deacylase